MSNSTNFAHAFRGAAVVTAMVCSVLLAPVLWTQIEAEAWRMLLDHYSEANARWLHWCLQACAYLLVFYVAQLTIFTAVGTAVLVGAMRLI